MKYLLFLLLLFPSIAFGTEYRIAILDFRGVGVTDEALISSLSDSVRTGLIKSVDTDEYLVMTRESTMQILKDMGKDASCMEGSCEVEIARNIGADYVVSGTVTLISETYLVTLKLHNTHTNALLSSEQVENKEALQLVKQMNSAGQRLLFEAKLIDTLPNTGETGKEYQEEFSGVIDEWEVSSDSSVIARFESNPSGAVVLVDGKMVCSHTPCSKAVPLGSHAVSIQKERYKIWSDRQTFEEGSVVSVELSPEFGILYVEVDVNRGVQFKLNDEMMWSPIRGKTLDKGQYVLTIEDDCYLGTKGQEYRFEIDAGDKKEISFPVKPRPAGIEVSVLDKDGNDLIAEVFVDGEYLGEAPNRFTVGICSENVEVRYEGVKELVYLDLEEKNIHPIEVILNPKKRKNDYYDQPSWDFLFGYRGGEYRIQRDENLDLDNGYISFQSGEEISDASIPIQPFFHGRNGHGFQFQAGVMGYQWYGNFNLGFLSYPQDQIYNIQDSKGESHPLVLDFDTLDLGFEAGYIAPFSYLRPMLGLTAGVDLFSANIITVDANSSWVEEGVEPYSLISTQTSSEGEEISPEFQKLLPYIGGTTGLIIQKPDWPVGISFTTGWKLNDIGAYSAYGLSIFFQVPMED